MKVNSIIEKLNNMNYLNNEDIIDNLNYIWNDLVIEMESLNSEELIEYNYEINSLVIEYLMKIIKKYYKEKHNIEINYDYDEIYSLAGTAAYDEENDKILLSILGMMFQAPNTSFYIQAPLHETRHKIQHDFYKEKDIEKIIDYPPYFIMIAKHFIYEKNHQENNRSFYKDNYNYLYSEVDAEEYSIEMTKTFIEDLFKNSNRNSLKQQILQDILYLKEDLQKRNRIDNTSSHELYTSSLIKSSFIINNYKIPSIILINKYIRLHKELQYKIPVLRLLFNDSIPKEYHEIILDKEILSKKYDKAKVENLYSYIIKSDPILQLSEYIISNNVDKIKEYIKTYPEILNTFSKELENILNLYNTNPDISDIFILNNNKIKVKQGIK